ncbi:hypothetical protein JW711_00525 [Candidatus Woesearchaeota archaeon]|nr:hypothetical protein [Candidatus Woesearchaeota archaeon]
MQKKASIFRSLKAGNSVKIDGNLEKVIDVEILDSCHDEFCFGMFTAYLTNNLAIRVEDDETVSLLKVKKDGNSEELIDIAYDNLEVVNERKKKA